MTGVPSAAELIDGVAEFLRDVSAGTAANLAYQARVAANALAIAGRDVLNGDAAARAAALRLQALLGVSGDRASLEIALCGQIAAGRITAATPGLLDHLWASTLDALAIDQPGYATYVRALHSGATAGEE